VIERHLLEALAAGREKAEPCAGSPEPCTPIRATRWTAQ
jgi:hypothetical protein